MRKKNTPRKDWHAWTCVRHGAAKSERMGTYVCTKTIEPKRMFHGNDLDAQRNFCGSGDLNAQRTFRGNGDLKVFEGQRKCDLVKLGRLQQDLVKLVLLRWRDMYISTKFYKI